VVDLDDRLRKTPRQARSRSTVEAILEAAERVLRCEGYSAASTNRVARVAGFSVGSLYQYFDDKQAVVGALLDHALRLEAEAIAQALDSGSQVERGAAIERVVRLLLAKRRSKAHLFRVLDLHGPEFCKEPPLRHVLRVQAAALADPLHRFAAAHFSGAFRGAFDEGIAVTARFVHALGYAFAVDAPEHLAEERVGTHAVRTLAALRCAAGELAPGAALLRDTWAGGSGAVHADATGRARRIREARSALMRAGETPPVALERTVFVAAAIGEVIVELREAPVAGLDPARVIDVAGRLLEACLDQGRDA
jgi:AcrR family transcriptional regulator